ncbi:hypothetical protein INT45_005602 [Circinella minor]|uniref:Uncharacterized protein n=1 Tax=Circinella minor TaxID=1195481 RepID=A0A8H7SC64_9FUNG|nr:hypothetical protein INT45_005602 [Circinella minor]
MFFNVDIHDVKAKREVPKSMYESLGLTEPKISILQEYKEVFRKLVAAGKIKTRTQHKEDNSVDDVLIKRSKVNHEEGLTQQEEVDAVVIGGNKSLLNDDDFLDKYHVLQCGYDVKAKPEVPQSMYEGLGLTEPKVSILEEHKEVFKKLVAAGKESIGELECEISRVTILQELGSFVKKIFNQFLNEIFKRKKHEIDRYETTYNFRLIWSLLVTIMDSLDESFKILGAQYNADGLCYIGDMEALVLETSGQYNNYDTPRWGYDHIKGTFALLHANSKAYSLMSIYHECHYALPWEFAAHARGDTVHIWTLSMPKPNVFVLERMTKIKIPTDIKECCYICNITKMLWVVK